MSNTFTKLVSQLTHSLEQENDQELLVSIEKYHPAKLGRLLESLPNKYRDGFWSLIPVNSKGEVLLSVHRELRQLLIKKTSEADLLKCLSTLQMDELADIDADLPLPVVSAMVEAMDSQRKERYQTVASFSDNTAGGMMDVDATAVRKDVSLKAVYRYLCKLRKKEGMLPEQLDQLVVVDRNNKVQGTLYLSDLVSMDNSLSVGDVMKNDVPLIDSLQSATQVAQIFEDHDLISAPVVDQNNYLLGRITVDDVIDVLKNSSEQRLLASAGLNEELDMFAPVAHISFNRAIWLGTNLITAFVAAWVIGFFEASIEQLVALAVLMPVVASMGGVTGSQTLTVVTRGIARDLVSSANIVSLTFHELKVSFINGLLWAAVVFIITILWYNDWRLGGVFALALFVVSLTGTLSGALIPIALKKLGVDPAIAGGVILTTITDAVGFLIFLGTATYILI
ncbi:MULTISPECIES: magnesium transporter [unclassified Colwellia]|jgi:magnesium transporter|uniref:magnesium transporter n=1 Tax=unclassified Colwellia TaxID=196834 RepID=UPI0015F4C985|nr:MULTISPECIES: magnesium transporter [unclassified Colwellia]MBA6231591.1 magnesium transporter [Colwellia sp. MB02u-7]MBA6235455.1 magnesium transporter [Colwellia sp. MB02u-11]MBA6254588.1 magnesium transporter [Colwellia sp. MB3u-28]MBA6259968.1 magnesium transporter [Colwellia sp. MB3u-41]MBA6299845.1 magnesium transporter [Colwellia sp. MB3u-22]